MRAPRAARRLPVMLITILLGGLLGAGLTRIAPGFGADERQLDARLSEESLRAVRSSRDNDRNILRFYGRYLAGLLRGDLGVSRSLGRPVNGLLAERIPVTGRVVGAGLVGGWLLGLAFALTATLRRSRALDLFFVMLTGFLLCLPSAVVALLFVLLRGPAPWAIALIIFPKVFRYSRNLLFRTYAQPHVLMAQAKGLSETRILLWHILPSVAPQMLALVGASVTLALGAAVPVEVLCDSPGIGQLAWLAALGRDLPLLVNLTVLVTMVTVTANSAAEWAIASWARHQS